MNARSGARAVGLRSVALAAVGLGLLGGRPSAEAILAAVPPELVEHLLEEGMVVLKDVGGCAGQ